MNSHVFKQISFFDFNLILKNVYFVLTYFYSLILILFSIYFCPKKEELNYGLLFSKNLFCV